MALVTAQQLTAGPGEKEEKFVKTMEAELRRWPNGQRPLLISRTKRMKIVYKNFVKRLGM